MLTATLTRDAYVDRLMSDLTQGALEAIGPRVPERASLSVELELWHAVNDAFRVEDNWRRWVDRGHVERPEAILLALVEGAFQVALTHGADGSFLELIADLRQRFEAITRQLRYRGLMRGPGGRSPLFGLPGRVTPAELN